MASWLFTFLLHIEQSLKIKFKCIQNDLSIVTSNTVVIPSLARHHLLSVFTCQAINNNITVPISNSITLDLNCDFFLQTIWFPFYSNEFYLFSKIILSFQWNLARCVFRNYRQVCRQVAKPDFNVRQSVPDRKLVSTSCSTEFVARVL